MDKKNIDFLNNCLDTQKKKTRIYVMITKNTSSYKIRLLFGQNSYRYSMKSFRLPVKELGSSTRDAAAAAEEPENDRY